MAISPDLRLEISKEEISLFVAKTREIFEISCVDFFEIFQPSFGFSRMGFFHKKDSLSKTFCFQCFSGKVRFRWWLRWRRETIPSTFALPDDHGNFFLLLNPSVTHRTFLEAFSDGVFSSRCLLRDQTYAMKGC